MNLISLRRHRWQCLGAMAAIAILATTAATCSFHDLALGGATAPLAHTAVLTITACLVAMGFVIVALDAINRRWEGGPGAGEPYPGWGFDAAPVMGLVLTPEGLIQYVNPAFEELTGYRLDEVRGRELFATLLPERDRERVRALFQSVKDGIATNGKAHAIVTRGGEERLIEWHDRVSRDPEGRVVQVVATGFDVTHRERFEQAMEESEQKYRSLVESAQDAIFSTDVTGRFLFLNRAAATALGATPGGAIGKSVKDFFSADTAEEFHRNIGHVISTGEPQISEQDLELHGQKLHFSTIVQPVRDMHGRVTALQLIARDITNLKTAERALRESEERLRQVVRVSHIGIFDHDHTTGEIYWSPQLREIYGWGPDEPVVFSAIMNGAPRTWDHIHAEDRERVAAALRRSHETQEGPFDIEFRIIRRDGATRWVMNRSQTFFEGAGDARRAVRTVGAVQDITERKQAERQLELTQSSVDKSNVAIFWINPSGEVTYGNEHACQSLGLVRNELIGKRVWDFDPDFTPEVWANAWQEQKRLKVIRNETRHRRNDGTIFPVETVGNYVVFEGEEHAFVFAQDITERQRAERELKLMHAAINTNRTPFYAVGPDLRIVYANEHACLNLGLTREELIGRYVWDIAPDFRPETASSYWARLRKEGMLRYETRHRRKDGTMLPVEVNANFFAYKGEEYSLAFAQDITERKQAEQAVRHSEERLHQVALVYHIGVFEHDHITGTFYWSPELRKDWGMSPEEPVLLPDIVESIHPEDRPQVRAAIERAFDPAGDGRYAIQHRVSRRDGSVIWLDVRSQTFFEGEGAARRPVRTVGAMVDITDRVEAARALQDSLREKETLLREVHHRVKNNLQIIASLLHFQAKKVKDPADLAAFNEGRDRLRSMVLVHEKLYQSPGLSQIDFGNYLRALVRDLRQSHAAAVGARIAVRVTADEVSLPIESVLPSGMIVCELLTNVFKYAFPAGRSGTADIRLSADRDRVKFVVSDDGVGLPPDFDSERSTSFGWQLIRNLTAQLGGTVTIDREAGTSVTISFPRLRIKDAGNPVGIH